MDDGMGNDEIGWGPAHMVLEVHVNGLHREGGKGLANEMRRVVNDTIVRILFETEPLGELARSGCPVWIRNYRGRIRREIWWQDREEGAGPCEGSRQPEVAVCVHRNVLNSIPEKDGGHPATREGARPCAG